MAHHTRRDCLIQAIGLAGASFGLRANAQEKYPRNPTKADIDRWMKELSNWGRWGKDDQAGTINLITPAKRKQAAALVKEGFSVSMSLDADKAPPGVPAAPAATATPTGGAAPQRPRSTWEHVSCRNG